MNETHIFLIAVIFINQVCRFMTIFIMPINPAYENMLLCNELSVEIEVNKPHEGSEMAKPMNKLLVSIVLLCVAFVLPTARAEQPQVTASSPGLLGVQLPGVDREELVDLVRSVRSQLILRKQELVQIVEDSSLKGSNAVLAAIMPGGLLYAGFQKARHENAKDELVRVSAAIEEYSSDILAMQPEHASVAIAGLP